MTTGDDLPYDSALDTRAGPRGAEPRHRKVLLTGATGYVGGRLLPELVGTGATVRCLLRDPARLPARVPRGVQLVQGDLLDPDSIERALDGIESAYYLVHSMGAPADFEERDRRCAENFVQAARRAGLRRIVYLGGLGSGAGLSPHLRSRQEVGEILRGSGIQVIEFRASIVIGPGSLSFEMLRALVERLPLMVTPRWVDVLAQPIAVDDLVATLLAALDAPLEGSRVFEIGGADRVSYGDLMREYARQRGLRRLMVRVPVLTPRLSGLWLGLVTPVYARIGRKLVESIKHPTIVEDDSALRVFAVRPRGMREALEAAQRSEERELAGTRWCDALSASLEPRSWAGVRFGNRLVDSRATRVEASPESAFAAVERIGGSNGWYACDWLWRLRGWMDLLVGGVGMRRGRRDPGHLRVGDVLDCWRVEGHEPERVLRLAAEMKLPGRAWLQFEVEPDGDGARIRQTAIFDPCGLGGLVYWYGIYPLHALVFRRMLRGVAAAAERRTTSPGAAASPSR